MPRKFADLQKLVDESVRSTPVHEVPGNQFLERLLTRQDAEKNLLRSISVAGATHTAKKLGIKQDFRNEDDVLNEVVEGVREATYIGTDMMSKIMARHPNTKE